MTSALARPSFMLAGAAPFTSRSLDHVHPLLAERFLRLVALWDARYRFRRLFLTSTYRNVAAQKALWAQGRLVRGSIVTYCDGDSQRSRHQAEAGGLPRAEAVDVAIRLLSGEPTIIKPVVTWNAALYRPLLSLAEEVGLVSGGRFRNRKGEPRPDWPHLELPLEFSA